MQVLPSLSPAMITAQLAFRAAFHDMSPRGGQVTLLAPQMACKLRLCFMQVYGPSVTDAVSTSSGSALYARYTFLQQQLCGEISQRPRGLYGDSCSVLQAFFVICYD